LPFKFSKIGRWWHKGEEIDIVALGDDKALFVEVKWREINKKEARRVVRELERKATLLDLNVKEYYGIFAKRIKEKDELREQGLLAWDLDDLDKATKIF
ncbi:ATP-binding protein, partial [Thermococci archaeon]